MQDNTDAQGLHSALCRADLSRAPCRPVVRMCRKLMDENENLKLEVQGLRSLMLQGVQLPGSSAIPTPALQVSCRRPVLPAREVAVICNEGGVALGLAERWH